MGGSTKSISTTPNDIRPLRSGLASWLQNGGQQTPTSSFQGGYGGQGQGQMPQPGGILMAPGANTTPQGFNGTGGIRPPTMGGFGYDQGSGGRPMSGWAAQPGAIDQNAVNANPQQYQQWLQQYNNQQPQTGGYNQMFASAQGGPTQLGPTAVASAPGQINPMQINPNAIPQVGSVGNVPQVQAGMLNPGDFNPMTGGFTPVGTQFNVPQANTFQRGQIQNVAPTSSGYTGTQSVDQLGGANSAFFNNMANQLRPAFQQNRAEALAQAKESLGNMGSGSALANSLGTAMNRSLGNEQAALANYASQGVQTEIGRQMNDAGQRAQVDMQNANRDMQANVANQGADMAFLNTLINQGNLGLSGQQLGLQGQMANQNVLANLAGQGAGNALQASMGNQNAGLNASGQNANNYLQAAGLNQNAQGQNQNAWLQSMLNNMGAFNNAQGQNIANSMNTQQFNAGQMNQANLAQGGFNQQWNQLVNQLGQQNANNYLQALLGMSTTGVAPNQVMYQPGVGSMLGGLAGTALGSFAGPLGAQLGGQLGKNLFGGGGTQYTSNPFKIG